MKLRQIAVAVAALSMAGASIAAGSDASTSSSASDNSYSTQARTSASEHGSGAMSSQNPSAASSNQNAMSSSGDATASSGSHDTSLVRSAQQALKDKGFDAGAVDGQMGPTTQSALRSFQQAQGLPQSGNLDQQTLAALGVQGEGSAASSVTGNEGSSATMSPSTSTSPDASTSPSGSSNPSTSSSAGNGAMRAGSTSSQSTSPAK